ncbi:MAG: HD domain-containing protein [Prolixibacteraceae bacterium]|jgi:HD superfamily phosphodiesterase|nr:HD domain-containing protein [Prolixibacteraceae bacterium]
MDNQVVVALQEMIRRNRGDKKRIEHSLKVFGYAQLLGRLEGLNPSKQFVLESAAVLHDIGIHVAEAKFGYCDGTLQELEGPPIARAILESIPVDPEVVDRVCFIISKHHTFSAIDDIDFQLLVEADFLVNSVEEEVSTEGVKKFVEMNFKSESGRRVIGELFAI